MIRLSLDIEDSTKNSFIHSSEIFSLPFEGIIAGYSLQALNIKQVNRKVQRVLQSQTAANPGHQEEEKKVTPREREKGQTLRRTKQTNKCTRSTHTSSLFPKRGDHNDKRNEETRRKRAREDFVYLVSVYITVVSDGIFVSLVK